MVNDAAFRSSIMSLALVMVIVGFYTHFFKKTVATYIFGMFAIGGVILPDWDFWCTPLKVDSVRSPSTPVSLCVVIGWKWWWKFDGDSLLNLLCLGDNNVEEEEHPANIL